MDLRESLIQTEQSTMSGLKDFQRATVERIDALFRSGQNRVLVADEVGLGKTLIARGAIAKMARLREEEHDKIFKVIYICSNQNIANQNIKKLNVFDVDIERVDETRLTMQHLKITEQEREVLESGRFVQLIPLTPGTSFQMTSGAGNVSERALLFAILKRHPRIKRYIDELDSLMMGQAIGSWEWAKGNYEWRVNQCNHDTGGKYIKTLLADIDTYNAEHGTLEELLAYLKRMRSGKQLEYKPWVIISKIRIMFANISVGMLNPDFVIMDEFQRFKFLIQDNDTETGILANKFLNSENIRILLLSATPYKLYSTLEEIEENQTDEHFSEFLSVMRFLFADEKKAQDFHKIWSNYSTALHELKEGDTAIIAVKNEAEDAMYGGVCRTERISVMETGDYTDDSSIHHHLEISEYDIRSYLEAGKLLNDIGADFLLPVDYVKSCPYLMSFMRNYKVKEKIEKYFMQHPEQISKARSNMLWIDKRKIEYYDALPPSNAKLEELKKQMFQKRSELYLWVPPSRPYYEMQGVYKDSQGFSKMLVFSAWEMVPRMIGGMISYEAERKTVGRLASQTKNLDRKNATYFADASKRFPPARLRFSVSQDKFSGMNLFCLIYPSKTLADLYEPIKYMKQNFSLAAIEKDVKAKLQIKLDVLAKKYQKDTSVKEDIRWYYMAPVLMDGAKYAYEWTEAVRNVSDNDDDVPVEERRNKGFHQHLDRLLDYIYARENIELGKMPDDLMQTLVNMVIGSPAICIYRSNGKNGERATELARIFINRFNSTEATAIIDLSYGRCKDDNKHWQNVLRYCKDGNFQAMFDEYLHLLTEGAALGNNSDLDASIHETMIDALKVHSATYAVDTYSELKRRVENQGEKKRRARGVSLRSHFAVGFTKSDGDDSKNVNRKESIRNAFNSPLRPFVLATTSIGQEGLDFHTYCRKIMHWNLPGNPIDLEQREGRINRYKCLAIRQNIAQKYGNIDFRSNDIWTEMFKAAELDKESNQSDLVPYWCLGKDQEVKIERIVPMYPVSKDEVNYERLIKVLSLYRLTLGQARQEELLDYMFKEFEDSEKLKELFINLSPFSKEKEG